MIVKRKDVRVIVKLRPQHRALFLFSVLFFPSYACDLELEATPLFASTFSEDDELQPKPDIVRAAIQTQSLY